MCTPPSISGRYLSNPKYAFWLRPFPLTHKLHWSLERFSYRRLFILDPTLPVSQLSIANWSIVYPSKTESIYISTKQWVLTRWPPFTTSKWLTEMQIFDIAIIVATHVLVWRVQELENILSVIYFGTPAAAPSTRVSAHADTSKNWTVLRGISENNRSINYPSKFRQLKKLKNCLYWRVFGMHRIQLLLGSHDSDKSSL